MGYAVLVWVPLLLLPIVLLLGFVGCTGEDPELVAQRAAEKAKTEQAAADSAQQKAQQQAAAEARKYDNQVGTNPNLVSFWRLGDPEGSGTIATDSAKGSPKDGAYTNVAGIKRGQPGVLALGTQSADKSAEFVGSSGYVEIAWDPKRNPPMDFSVELWIKPTGNIGTPQVVYASYELNEDGKFVRGMALDFLPGSPPQIQFRLGDGAAPTALIAGLGNGLQFGGWRHIVATYLFASRTASLYVDASGGKPAKKQPDPGDPTSTPVTFVANQAAPTRIAAGLASNQAPLFPAAQYFGGQIDEVALYNVCLDGETIRQHYAAAISPASP